MTCDSAVPKSKTVTDVHQHAFIKDHFLGLGKNSVILGWLVSYYLISIRFYLYLKWRLWVIFLNRYVPSILTVKKYRRIFIKEKCSKIFLFHATRENWHKIMLACMKKRLYGFFPFNLVLLSSVAFLFII